MYQNLLQVVDTELYFQFTTIEVLSVIKYSCVDLLNYKLNDNRQI